MPTVRTQADPSSRSGHGPGGAQPAGPARTLRVLFVMRSLLGYLRFYRSSLELLVERGHDVRLLIERDDHGEVEQRWLERMLEHPNFACEVAQHFGGKRERKRRASVRRGIEYVRVLRDGVDRSTIHFRHRLRDVPPDVLRLTERPLVRTRLGLRVLHAALSATDRLLSVPAPALAYVAEIDPDVAAVCDHGNVGSLHSAYAAAAQQLGVPTAVCVATWDNLSSRQRLRVKPHELLVWNGRQREEAVELHGVPAERVVVTGAPSFDAWFSPVTRPRSEFLARVGLDPARPYVLWVGGALYESERTEAAFAYAWIAALRASGDPALRELGVLLRPHPRRLAQWREVDFAALSDVAVFPEIEHFPSDDEAKADYVDSVHHAIAVVGINTSAMIEASITGRPVLAVLAPEFHDSQLGTAHFPYLLESSGGAVRLASSVEEQLEQLGAIVSGEDRDASERAQRFVAAFVRPNGLDRPATPIFVEALERLADRQVSPQPDPLWVRLGRGLGRIGRMGRR